MIKYNLTCKCGEVFESWFSSSSEFDTLYKKKLIKCIYCQSAVIKKSAFLRIASGNKKLPEPPQIATVFI